MSDDEIRQEMKRANHWSILGCGGTGYYWRKCVDLQKITNSMPLKCGYQRVGPYSLLQPEPKSINRPPHNQNGK